MINNFYKEVSRKFTEAHGYVSILRYMCTQIQYLDTFPQMIDGHIKITE